MADTTFSKLSDDVVLKIFFHLEDDPRNWARLTCVCRKFSSLISTVCCKSKCLSAFPAISADVISLSSSSASSSGGTFPGGWAALHKLAVCCPGLLHAGVLLDNSDFGLHRELGSDDDFHCPPPPEPTGTLPRPTAAPEAQEESFGGWSLYDDLYFDTIYNNDESLPNDPFTPATTPMDIVTSIEAGVGLVSNNSDDDSNNNLDFTFVATNECGNNKKRKISSGRSLHRMQRSHLASGAWSLSREQGNKLLASRFRGDCLYLCDWPGCVHIQEKRNYMLFRGFFNNFKRSRVWRAISDANRNRIDINCAFCSCKETWDLHSAFCLRRGFGFHDDGEPVVRAYVCENGHVSGAWTDLPIYS